MRIAIEWRSLGRVGARSGRQASRPGGRGAPGRTRAARSGCGSRSSPRWSTRSRTRAWASATPAPAASPPAAGSRVPCAAHSSSSAITCSTLRGRRAPARGDRTHRHVVLLVGADVGIESTDAGWASTLFSDTSAAAVYWTSIMPVLRPASVDEERRQARRVGRRSSCAMRRSRDRAELGHGDRQQVHRQRDRLAVEVAAGDRLAAAGRGARRIDVRAVGEDERVVGRGVDLELEHAPHVGQRVRDRAVDLRHAADRVRVLDLVRLRVVRSA